MVAGALTVGRMRSRLGYFTHSFCSRAVRGFLEVSLMYI